MKYFLFVPILILTACTDPSSVSKYAKMEGWDKYELTGYKWFSCSDDDFYSSGFKATKNGVEFTGTVCSGLLFKGSTLRMD